MCPAKLLRLVKQHKIVVLGDKAPGYYYASTKDITWFGGIKLDIGKKKRQEGVTVAHDPWILQRKGF